jgi:hypothetical protein
MAQSLSSLGQGLSQGLNRNKVFVQFSPAHSAQPSPVQSRAEESQIDPRSPCSLSCLSYRVGSVQALYDILSNSRGRLDMLCHTLTTASG